MKKRPEPRHWRKKVISGFVLAAIGLGSIGAYEMFETHAVHAKGHVIDLKQESQRTGRRGNTITAYRPLLRFTIPGADKPTEMKTVHASARYNFDIGTDVDIEFDPTRPEETLRIDTGISGLDLGVTIIGLAVMAMGIEEKRSWNRAQRA